MAKPVRPSCPSVRQSTIRVNPRAGCLELPSGLLLLTGQALQVCSSEIRAIETWVAQMDVVQSMGLRIVTPFSRKDLYREADRSNVAFLMGIRMRDSK